MVKLVDTLA